MIQLSFLSGIRSAGPDPTTAIQTSRLYRLLLATLLILVPATGHTQNGDDYLKEIEGVMEGVDTAPEKPATSSGTAPAPQQQNEFLDQIDSEIEDMGGPDGLDSSVPENARDQFESDLQDRMPGTFVLYKRLPTEKRDKVFDEYQVSGDYLRVRRKIIEIRRGK